MTTPTFVGSASSGWSIQSTPDATVPAVSADDIALLFVIWQTNATVTDITIGGAGSLADWTLVRSQSSDANTAQQVTIACYSRVLDGTEDSDTLTVTLSAPVNSGAYLAVVDGDAVDVSAAQGDEVADVATAPAVTATVDDGLVLNAYAVNRAGDTLRSPDTDWTSNTDLHADTILVEVKASVARRARNCSSVRS